MAEEPHPSWDHEGAEYEDPTARFQGRPHATSIAVKAFGAHISDAQVASNAPIEDRLVVEQDAQHIFAAVYDGHGGTKTSSYLAAHFYPQLRARLEAGEDVEAAFKAAVPAADAAYTAKAKERKDWSMLFTGSCLIAAYVDKQKLGVYVANCGDSRAVIGSEEPESGILCATAISWDHSAGSDYEKFRVRCEFEGQAAVIRETWDEMCFEYAYRVKDFARFTRSIGDVQLKDPACAKKFNSLQSQIQILPLPGTELTTPYISNEPAVHYHQLHRRDKFMVIASDGLWDEMSSDQVVHVTGHLIATLGKHADISAALLGFCKRKIVERLLLEEPDEGIESVADLDALPAGKDGRRGLMDDISIVVLVFEDENVTELPAAVEVAKAPVARRSRLSSKAWHAAHDEVGEKLEADPDSDAAGA